MQFMIYSLGENFNNGGIKMAKKELKIRDFCGDYANRCAYHFGGGIWTKACF